MAKRSKSGKILIYIGEDSRKHMRRVAALEKAASDRANRKAAREAASIQRKAFRKVGGATMQMARKAARDRATLAKREARRRGNNKPTEEYNRQREENARKKRKKRPFHPRGPYATEKYTSYARREERSKRLRATRSSPNTFTCNGYTIKVTIGSNPVPLSCTCPDFTQIGGGRNWSGSNAGPFNPCKHMMAVRDQNDQKWSCSGGVCSPDANGPYNSQAECEAALIPPTFTGGQCAVLYRANYISEMRRSSTGALILSNSYSNLIEGTPMGPILTGPVRTVSGGSLSFPVIASNGTFYCNLIGSSHRPSPHVFDYFIINFSFSRIDGLPDNCGNAPSTCP